MPKQREKLTVRKVYACSICGAERRQANHWFVAEQTAVGLHIHTWAWGEGEDQLDADNQLHLCGEACAHQLLDRFLTSAIRRPEATEEQEKKATEEQEKTE